MKENKSMFKNRKKRVAVSIGVIGVSLILVGIVLMGVDDGSKIIFNASLNSLIQKHNKLITVEPNLTTSSNNSQDSAGLYSSTETTNGKPTYYFRGDVANNNVKFAGFDWKIIRINEDGTIRLILNKGIKDCRFHSVSLTHDNMYYSNESYAKEQLDNWYKENITDKGYDTYVANSTFCEQAKVKETTNIASGSAIMDMYTTYTPSFNCSTDGNGKGLIHSKVALITLDEVIYAGGFVNNHNFDYYLRYGDYSQWTMSTAGYDEPYAYSWYITAAGMIRTTDVQDGNNLRPVINLSSTVSAIGTGTENDPYVVKTK